MATTEGMKKAGLDDVLLIAGRNIPRKDVKALKEMGVDEVFHPVP